jgi:hypothetical protein
VVISVAVVLVQRHLSVCARALYRLCELFAGTAAEALDEYALVQRLLEKQCHVVKKKKRPRRADDDAGEGGVPVVLKAPNEVRRASLQRPHDADAPSNARTGKGYEAQGVETCHEDNPLQVITPVELTHSCARDAQTTMPILEDLAARDQLPQEWVADTAYGSAEHAVEAARIGTELVRPVSGRPVAVEARAPEPPPLTGADFHVDASGEDPPYIRAAPSRRSRRSGQR